MIGPSARVFVQAASKSGAIKVLREPLSWNFARLDLPDGAIETWPATRSLSPGYDSGPNVTTQEP